jgi:hypothetical protein
MCCTVPSQVQLYEMYRDAEKAFRGYQFYEFRQLCEFRHEQIHVVWIVDMNESKKVLAFSVGEMRIPAKHEDKVVTREIWCLLIKDMKSECAGKHSFLSSL